VTWNHYKDGFPPGRWLLWHAGNVVGMLLPLEGDRWATYYLEAPGGRMVHGTKADDLLAGKATVEAAVRSRGVVT